MSTQAAKTTITLLRRLLPHNSTPSPIPPRLRHPLLRRQVHLRSTKPLHNTIQIHPTRPLRSAPPGGPNPSIATPPKAESLSSRFRTLTRQYGSTALVVYFLLSALDFPFCFAFVRYVGAERIGHYEHVVAEWVGGHVPGVVRRAWGRVVGVEERLRREVFGGIFSSGEKEGTGEAGKLEAANEGGKKVLGSITEGLNKGRKVLGGEGKGMEKVKEEGASLWTQLAVAYAIHKSFIFVRVPAAVAVTPRFVRLLRGWGWNIGKKGK